MEDLELQRNTRWQKHRLSEQPILLYLSYNAQLTCQALLTYLTSIMCQSLRAVQHTCTTGPARNVGLQIIMQSSVIP